MSGNRRRSACAVLLVMFACAGGCATIVTGTSQTVTVTTDPAGAACKLARKGMLLGSVDPTPGTLKIEKTKDDIEITCKKKGYLDAGARLPSTLQGWTLGNIALGGLIGVAIDAGTGALHEYQKGIQVSLAPEQFNTIVARDSFFDAWRVEVMREAERAKQEIAKTCAGSQCDELKRKADTQAEVALAEIELTRARAKLDQATKALTEAPASPKAAPSTSASTFLKPGDKWKYALNERGRGLGLVTIEVDAADGNRVRERITMGGFKAYQAERIVSEQFNATRFQSVVVLPGGHQMAEIAPYFPPGTIITAGQKWDQVPSEIGIIGAGKRAFVSEVTVTGREKVRVPAGEFDAWRIEAISDKVSYAGTGNATQVRCTFWYSPQMQRTVKMSISIESPIIAAQANETYELAAFEPGR